MRNRLIEALHGTEEGRKRIGDAINRIYDHAGRLGPVDAPQERLHQNAGGEVMSDDPSGKIIAEEIPGDPQDGVGTDTSREVDEEPSSSTRLARKRAHSWEGKKGEESN